MVPGATTLEMSEMFLKLTRRVASRASRACRHLGHQRPVAAGREEQRTCCSNHPPEERGPL